MAFVNRRNPGVTGGRVVDISVLLDRVLQKHRIAEDMNLRVLSERFEEAVGSAVFPHVKLVKLDKRTMVLKAESSAWKQELFLQKNAIIARCNSMLGTPFIQAIRFV